MNQAVAVFRAMPGLENKYLMYVLMSPSALRWMKGRAKTTAGQTNLTLETCRDVPIPLPPLAEQRRIASTLDAKLSAVSAAYSAAANARRRADRLRVSILRSAFDGTLVAPGQPARAPAA